MKLPAASVEMMVWVEKRVSPLRSLPKAQTAPVEMTVRVVKETDNNEDRSRSPLREG
jgi:hypothetical protein